jgi:hypothetical protein
MRAQTGGQRFKSFQVCNNYVNLLFQDHADGNVKRGGTDASWVAVGDDNKVICIYSSCELHGVAQVATHRLHPRGLELSMSIMKIWLHLPHA